MVVPYLFLLDFVLFLILPWSSRSIHSGSDTSPRPPSARLAFVATSLALALPSSPSASSAATPGLEPLADRVLRRPSLRSVRRLLSDSSSAAPPGREPLADRRASRRWGASNRATLLRGPLPPSSSPGAYLRPSSSAAAGDSRVPGMRIEVRYNSCVATWTGAYQSTQVVKLQQRYMHSMDKLVFVSNHLIEFVSSIFAWSVLRWSFWHRLEKKKDRSD